VDLRVAAGVVVGLVGPNGSGKTTLLRAAAGLITIDEGSIRVAGAPAGSRPARQATALVPDEPTGFDELTVAEFVALVHALWAADEKATGRARMLMAAFGLDDRSDQRLGTLSRGLRRQASAVAALSLAPPLVLVDEATATLDPEAVVVLSEAVAALASRGCGVLLATQDLHFAAGACHEIVLLHRGAVIDRGEPGALRARHSASSLEGVFLAAVGDGRLRERVRNAFRAL
jgi:ABC-2 type transport system ATP-binding protein